MSVLPAKKGRPKKQLYALSGLMAGNFCYALFIFWLTPEDSQLTTFIQMALIALTSALAFMVFYRYNKREMEMKKVVEDLSANDKLTGLPNRAKFSQVLHDQIGTGANHNPFALMLLDIDRFKELNTILGYKAADKLLLEFGARLTNYCQNKNNCARLSGNEFAVIVPYDGSGPDLETQMHRLFASLYKPYICDDKAVDITMSGGIALFPDDDLAANQLAKDAELALLRAKAQGHNTIFCYEETADEKIHEFQLLSHDMDRALREGEFKLFFQPQFSFDSGDQIGFEALIRWEHPEKGLVSPADFIPLAEKNGMIVPISEFVLMEACKTAATWVNPLRVGVNLSPVQFQQIDVAELTERALRETGLAPDRLELEVTESLFINISDGTADMLRRIQILGVSIALDDFGTGYSSLNYLNNFPFNKLKIDRSFVKDLAFDNGAMAIISAVIGMAKSLEMRITAEGIDNPEVMEILKIAGCHEAQGFLLGKPRDIREVPGIEMDAPQKALTA
ncbi:MAG: bifunctional diguanylate cyclase/phosphodiesterase [Cohaesibacter sp.]|jgi:diguanylate cyclase (GGDEF)-like protein|nr:bifunctional diguanylate cyclase/phosphodiesterase [Cohaesibacter sp.]